MLMKYFIEMLILHHYRHTPKNKHFQYRDSYIIKNGQNKNVQFPKLIHALNEFFHFLTETNNL